MAKYVNIDEWSIIEENLHLNENKIYESLMSIGNGHMGMRGNFEEDFSGSTLQGTYIAGVYYPDKTRVGWWKNGYPEYFAKVLNSTNFIGISVKLNGEIVDLAKAKINNFKRILNMREGYLLRTFTLTDSEGRETNFEVKRFFSMAEKELAAISYSIEPVNHTAEVEFTPYLDGDVMNEDSNYDEKFWLEVDKFAENGLFYLTQKTKKTEFVVTCASKYALFNDGNKVEVNPEVIIKPQYAANKITLKCEKGSKATLYKYIAVTSNRYFEENQLVSKAVELVEKAYLDGYDKLFRAHSEKWAHIWKESDIVISGDPSAQQGIRFNIFHMNCTYTGDDPRLNIGPKGFTGEKYGGSTYWDTEAYCIPFYLSTSDQSIARNLLIYRYNHLEKAKENARKLGLKGALYPMVTINGEECHNEWEITFEEIHRNAAISYAIYNYVNYTGDESYLQEYGFDVLVETSRFWVSRCNYNSKKDVYMILGVTGPNEYENNVNNNWYTNTMAAWNIEYTLQVAELLKDKYANRYNELVKKLQLTEEEMAQWVDVVKKMYKPEDKELGIFLQQDGYMDKEQMLVKDLPKEDLPLNQKWSWDRILRSCFIKQADVLQGLYFLNDRFDLETKKRNFDFYEPRTVHESSLSPCIYSIIAAEIGYEEKAYELYLRTARLDLDNYNNDSDDGLHITSMAGTWMSIVHGFGGLRVVNGMLSLKPFIPKAWEQYSFKIVFRDHLLKVTVKQNETIIEHQEGSDFELKVNDKVYALAKGSTINI
ncbi:glycoside hydrolase family 65 protein [Clostridium thermarum]|uniref:glycoside hydrolase family 65 protein n=1 Tax=Clostridium thermarum TaxID=1716543 RepID=UPI0013D04721|nr:glycoside hydrolase family 65 protein [Clostridium thermarum]